MAAGGLICGLPSYFFIFFRPLLIIAGFILGIMLGLLWTVCVLYLQRFFYRAWHFGMVGFGIGLVGALIWGIFAFLYLKDAWVIVLIVNALLILPLAGSVGSLLGQRNLDKGNSSRKSDFVLRLTLGCEVVLFILLPMIRSVFIMGK